MCGSSIFVKNTFICAVEDGLDSPPSAGRQRARTEGHALAGARHVLHLEPLEEEPWTESAIESTWGSAAESAAGSVAQSATALEADGAAAGAEPSLAADIAGVLTLEALEDLAAGGARAEAAAAAVCEEAGRLSFDVSGGHAVQLALERAGPAQAARALAGLRGAIVAAARSRCASAVLEKAIHVAGQAAAECVTTALLGYGRATALNPGGCCVVRALLEHAAGQPWVVELTDELMTGDRAALCCHKHGHVVAQAVLSNGLARQRAALAATLRGDPVRFGKHRFATLVLQHALLQGTPTECRSLAQGLMANSGAVASLACHCFGVDVVRALLQVPGASKLALEYVRRSQHKLRKDLFGAELLRELGLQGTLGSKECGGQGGQPRPQAFAATPPFPPALFAIPQGCVAIPQRQPCPQVRDAIVLGPARLPGVAAGPMGQRCLEHRGLPVGAIGGA